MKSLAFVVVGLAVGAFATLILFNSGGALGPSQNSPSATPNESVQTEASPRPSGNVVFAGGKLSFVKYTLILPTNWKYSKESPYSEMETVLLSSGDYSIMINQAPSEGGTCTYNKSSDPNVPFTSNYKFYKELKTQDNTVLRRGGDTAGGSNFIVCAYSSQNSNYQQPTPYGYTNIKTPANPDVDMLKEIDQILSSLKKSV